MLASEPSSLLESMTVSLYLSTIIAYGGRVQEESRKKTWKDKLTGKPFHYQK